VEVGRTALYCVNSIAETETETETNTTPTPTHWNTGDERKGLCMYTIHTITPTVQYYATSRSTSTSTSTFKDFKAYVQHMPNLWQV
jgi:hypothetical protein